MNLQAVFEATQFKISGGSPFFWTCFGPFARRITFSANDCSQDDVDVIFDANSQVVYEIEFYPTLDTAYRWINPEFKDAFLQEYQDRGLDPTIVDGSEYWIDVSLGLDLVAKIKSYFLSYDVANRVSASFIE